MARQSGPLTSSVQRIWRAFGLQPHRTETFKLSTDPMFVEKVRDGVGLHLAPPERAIVLCVDEKSQVQALDRSQPVLPGQVERRTHDPSDTAATTVFAALDTASGKVVGSVTPPSRRGVQALPERDRAAHPCDAYIERRNDPRPFTWVRTADDILDAISASAFEPAPTVLLPTSDSGRQRPAG